SGILRRTLAPPAATPFCGPIKGINFRAKQQPRQGRRLMALSALERVRPAQLIQCSMLVIVRCWTNGWASTP
ncbi:MAG TPA: hypothetical protein VMV87_02375, partial [Burkholderiales bacterium]|nr:hypothetical protein [Burkholderiales bacterium]